MQKASKNGGTPVLESHEMVLPFHATLMGVQTNQRIYTDSAYNVDRNIRSKVIITGDPHIGTP